MSEMTEMEKFTMEKLRREEKRHTTMWFLKVWFAVMVCGSFAACGACTLIGLGAVATDPAVQASLEETQRAQKNLNDALENLNDFNEQMLKPE